MVDICLIILGLVIGSFLTVCIFRVPYGREKGPGEFASGYDDDSNDVFMESESKASLEVPEVVNIYTPARSVCPNCWKKLKWYHNIPLISWFLLRGKCAFCHKPISFRYPLVELLSAFLCWFSFYSMPDVWTATVVYAFCCTLLVISFIDIDYYIIPNVISIPMIYLGGLIVGFNHIYKYCVGKAFFYHPVLTSVWGSVWGLIAGAGVLWLVAKIFLILRKKEGLGFGDIKLLAMVGILFGPQAAIYTIMVGSCLGSVFGLVQLAFQRKKIGYPLPFGPYLAIGALLYFFLDPAIDPFRKVFYFLR